jgi:hypothetical protein
MSDSPFWLPTMPHFPEAACADIEDTEIFFQTKTKEIEKVIDQVRELCFSCPHQKACVEYAIDEEIEYGIWGGYTASQRKRMKPKKIVKHRSDLGQKAFSMREAGATFREIATELDCTVSAAQKAVNRFTMEGAQS